MGEKKEFISGDAIATFIYANILHAVDNKLLDLDIDQISVTAEKLEVDKDKLRITLTSTCKDKEHTDLFFMPYLWEDKNDHYRSMMGVTMQVLTLLKARIQDKQVLRLI